MHRFSIFRTSKPTKISHQKFSIFFIRPLTNLKLTNLNRINLKRIFTLPLIAPIKDPITAPLFPLCLLLALLLLPLQAAAVGSHWPILDTPKHWIVDENSYHINYDLSYDVSTRNFLSNGHDYKPGQLLDVHTWEHRLHFAYPFLPRFSAFAQISYRIVEDSFTAPSNTTGASTPETSSSGQISRNGPADTMLALRWLQYSNRRIGGRFATASEIFPSTFRSIFETALVIPTYGSGTPPLGNKSTDWQSMWRTVWFPTDWFSLSSGVGYIIRTTPYSPAIPFSARSDFYFPNARNLQVWLEWKGQKSLQAEKVPQFTFTSNTLLYGASSPTQYWAGLGLSARAWKDITVAASAYTNYAGQSGPRESVFSLGAVFRLPSEHSEEFYIPRRDIEVGGLAGRADFQGYEWTAPIIKVTKGKENFFKVTRGLREGVRMTDEYHVYQPGEFTPEGKSNARFLGSASVVALKPNFTIFKLQRAYQSSRVHVGDEVRCVKSRDPGSRAKIYP